MTVQLFKLALPLGLVGALSGCLSPLDQCLNSAGQEAREIRRELVAAQRAVRFGYRTQVVMAPAMVPAICMGPGQVPEHCLRWSQETREIHHPINRANERERIQLMERQLARAERREAQAAAQCRATYPAE